MADKRKAQLEKMHKYEMAVKKAQEEFEAQKQKAKDEILTNVSKLLDKVSYEQYEEIESAILDDVLGSKKSEEVKSESPTLSDQEVHDLRIGKLVTEVIFVRENSEEAFTSYLKENKNSMLSYFNSYRNAHQGQNGDSNNGY